MHQGAKGYSHRHGAYHIREINYGPDKVFAFNGRGKKDRHAQGKNHFKAAGKGRVEEGVFNSYIKGIF
jgi:hypothetical protein